MSIIIPYDLSKKYTEQNAVYPADLTGQADGDYIRNDGGVYKPKTLTALDSFLANQPRLVAYDSFNRANGALGNSDSGHTWLASGTAYLIDSQEAVPNAFTDGHPMNCMYIDLGAITEYTAMVDLSNRRGVARRRGFLISYTNDTNYWVAVVVSINTLRIIKVAAGVTTDMASTVFAPTMGHVYSTIKIRVEPRQTTAGSNFWFSDDMGARIILDMADGADNDHFLAGSGKVGIIGERVDAGSKDAFKNFRVYRQSRG